MRNLNSIRTWLRSNTDGPVKLSDVICIEDDAEISYCNAKMMEDSCKYNQSVWLNCNKSTGDTQLLSTYQLKNNMYSNQEQRSQKNETIINLFDFDYDNN